MDLNSPADRVSLSIPIDDASSVGIARLAAIEMAEALHFNESGVGRVAVVVREAATNIIQHAGCGEILLRPTADQPRSSLELLALDKGLGIANVAQAIQDGFSTAGAPGLGLGNIRRLSSRFEISSWPGKGTAVLSHIGHSDVESSIAAGLQWGAVCVPMKGQEVCGDSWAVAAGNDRNTVLVVDGLGHGPPAFEAAQQVLHDFWKHPEKHPASSLAALHDAMRATPANRGAVAAVAEIDWRKRELTYAGAGNISGTLLPVEGKAHSMISHNGTLGQSITRLQEFVYAWPEQGLLILHSDGVSQVWNLDSYPGLSQKHPSLIAGVLYRDFANRQDDAVILVGRESAALT